MSQRRGRIKLVLVPILVSSVLAALSNTGIQGKATCIWSCHIILVKKIMWLGLFFRTRQWTCVHHLGMQKCEKFEKRVCFGHIYKFLKVHDGKIQKKACKNVYLGSIFIPGRYVLRVFWKCFYEDDFEPEIQVPFPSRAGIRIRLILPHFQHTLPSSTWMCQT